MHVHDQHFRRECHVTVYRYPVKNELLAWDSKKLSIISILESNITKSLQYNIDIQVSYVLYIKKYESMQ